MLYTRGWIKEADPNSLADRRVDPLPAVRESLTLLRRSTGNLNTTPAGCRST